MSVRNFIWHQRIIYLSGSKYVKLRIIPDSGIYPKLYLEKSLYIWQRIVC